MGKIKIHEIAKELNLASKEVIAKASELNIKVTSHLSGVTEEEAKKIKGAFGKKVDSKKGAQKQESVKKEKKDTPVIIRREVIINDEENKKEEKKAKEEQKKSNIGFVERERKR